MSTQLGRMEEGIERIKQKLLALGPMRPGSITRQYRLPQQRRRPYYQISYTHLMKSRTEYVRTADLARLRAETAAFKRFRKLVAQWVDLALKRSQMTVRKTHLSD